MFGDHMNCIKFFGIHLYKVIQTFFMTQFWKILMILILDLTFNGIKHSVLFNIFCIRLSLQNSNYSLIFQIVILY